jgi:hypothetical protein
LYLLVKLKNIEEINNSTALITEENEGQEKQLIDIKAKMKEVRDEILRFVYILNFGLFILNFFININNCCIIFF